MVGTAHVSVLLKEAVDAICLRPDGVYVDATFGRGGHSRELLSRLGPRARVIALDRDPSAAQAAEALGDARLTFSHRPFSQLPELLAEMGISDIDGLIADLGVSSPQLDEAQRGFSFRNDGPLDMRMDPTRGLSAAQWLAHVEANDLEEVLREYGEERHARAIAGAIVARREAATRGEEKPLERTSELASLVEQTLRRSRASREPGQHPATRTFQALRIYLNQELEELDTLLREVPRRLRPGGRMAVISFHSLEDRRVKQAFREASGRASLQRPAGMGRQQFGLLTQLETQKPSALLNVVARIRPSRDDIALNPRARSAVMRVAERSA